MTKILSPEIASLVHHVELNESGWWKKAVSQVTRALIWSHKSPVLAADIRDDLAGYGIPTPIETVERQLDALSSSGHLLHLPDGRYKLAESTAREMDQAHQQVLEQQASCKALFTTACLEHCSALDPDALWSQFSTELLTAVHIVGANTFHLLSGTSLEKDADWISRFTAGHGQKHEDGLRKVVAEFFKADNRSCRDHVLRLLSAHFFAEAAQLKPETLDVIDAGRKKRAIKIVLDTNFIFSVLGLHDNPANDSATALLKLAGAASKYLEIKLYVVPGTIEEATRTISAHMESVKRIRTTHALARAAADAPLSGMAVRFFKAAEDSPGLTGDSFFRPYIDDLKTILKRLKIEELDAHHTAYSQRRDVVDDVMHEYEREKARPENRRKSYETVLHDVVLWHVIHDRRRGNLDSPFEVEYWSVSIDWRLIGFDKVKREQLNIKVPLVLYPTNLLQLIQFWVPRSPELDATLVDSLRLPLFFHSFDIEDEKVTLRIVSALSRYENLDDLPESAITPLLVNQALRNRIKEGEVRDEEVMKLIREELLIEHRRTQEVLKETDKRLKQTEHNLNVVANAKTSVEALAAEERAKREKIQQDLVAVRERADDLDRHRKNAEKEKDEKTLELNTLRKQIDADRLLNQKRMFLLFSYVLPVSSAVGLGWWVHEHVLSGMTSLAKWQIWIGVGGSAIMPVAIASVIAHFYLKTNDALMKWWPGNLIEHTYKKLVVGGLVSAGGAIWQGGVFEGIRLLVQ